MKRPLSIIFKLIVWAALLYGIAATAYHAGEARGRAETEITCNQLRADLARLPSLVDIQKMVGAKPDGRYGPETKRLWDRAYCDQAAKEMWAAIGPHNQ